MKIIYLHQHFKSPQMSGGTRSYEMAKRWADAGHDVHIIAARTDLPPEARGWQTEKMAGFTLHGLNVPYSNNMSYSQRIKAFAAFALKSASKAKSVGGDIVFATSTPLTIALPGVYAARALKIPMVFEVRDLWPEMPIAIGAIKNPAFIWATRRLEKFAYNNAKHVIALSPGMADGVADTGYPREQITIAPNSCDVDFFDQTGSRAEEFLSKNEHLRGRRLVAYTGAFGKMNNVGYLTEIAQHMSTTDPDIAFVVAGDGYEFEHVRKSAEEKNILGKNFFLIGRISKAEIPPILSACTVATSIFTDLKEHHANSANKFFDGLASAKPVMINYGGWQADLLKEYQNGIEVPAADASAAAAQLSEFMSDGERLKSAGIASFKLANDKFLRDDLASKVLEALQTVADSHTG